MSIIKKLIDGSLNHPGLPLTQKAKELMKAENKYMEQIENEIGDKDKAFQLLNAYTCANNASSSNYGTECLEYGFILGVQIMIAVYEKELQ